MVGWYGDAWSSGYGWAMVAMMLLMVALVALAVWAGVRLLGREDAPTPTPRAQLDRRLAAGEIDAEEYAQLRRLLEDRAVRPTVPGEEAGRR